jgi:hypothetical protein
MLRAAAPAVWALAAIGLALSPLACTIPGLGLLRGPLGWALALSALILTAARALPVRVRPPEPGTGALLAATSVLFVGVGQYYTSRLRVSGDEPHYLLMAQSLWREGDLDLRDNLEREDWSEYTPGPLAPHYGAPRRDGRPYPAHSPGLPLLLAPIYALGGRRACAAAIGLAAAALTVVVRALALRAGAPADAALVAWAVAAGPPVFFYSFHIYTEVPCALAIAAALCLLTSNPRGVGAASAGLLAGTLPWLHVKMIPAALALGAVALARLRGRALIAFGAGAASMAAAYLAYWHHVFGTPNPLATYGGVPSGLSGLRWRALAGLALDRSFGLLPYAPVFLLALGGLGLLARRRDGWPLVAVGALTLAPVLPWRMWWGGQSPPGRFLVPLVPTLAVAVALAAARRPRGLSRWAWPLTLAGFGLAFYAVGDPGRLLLLNRGDRPTRLWAALSTGGADAERYLPSMVRGGAEDWRVAAVWAIAISALLVLDRFADHERVDGLFRSVGFPLAVLVLVSLAVDAWARPPASAQGLSPQCAQFARSCQRCCSRVTM